MCFRRELALAKILLDFLIIFGILTGLIGDILDNEIVLFVEEAAKFMIKFVACNTSKAKFYALLLNIT